MQGILRRCAPLLDRERQLTAGKGDIFSGLCIIVAELDRRYGKIAITAGYERVLEALSSLDIGGFHVILLEIRREVDLRSLEQGDIAGAGDVKLQGSGIVHVERIFG